jgi:hypothetical protein
VIVLREEQPPQPVRFRHHPRQEYGVGMIVALKAAPNMWKEEGK